MVKFRCLYGHTEVIKGELRPLVHPSRPACSIYVQLRREAKVDIFGRALPGMDISDHLIARPPAGQPVPPTPGAGAAASPAAAPKLEAPPKKEPLIKRLSTGLGVRYRDVTTTAPGAAGTPAQNADWLASEETTERFWQAIFGFIEQLVHLFTNFMEIPPVPEEVFRVDPGQSFVFRTALRPFTTNILKRVFGAKSPEEADRIVAGLSGLLGFGMMGMKIVIHFMIHLPKSPKLLRWRAAAKLRAEKRREGAAGTQGPIDVDAKTVANGPIVRIPG